MRFTEAVPRWKMFNHPTHGDNRPGEQDHIGVESNELSHADAMSDHQMAASQQGNNHGDAQNELERGPGMPIS